ncbi:MAG TPA: RNA polymerase sigma factor [Candidatus Dormibacteraeota bacterium]|nr:RNA polymerase sigma factor [Candidatus Dormibacteraeota bacterium]
MQEERTAGVLRLHPAGVGEPRELARAARGGDLRAFETLVRRYQRRVYGFAYQLLRDPDEAQDLAQEVFVRLYRNLDRFDTERPFEPWFWRLAANVAATYRRRRPAPTVELPRTTPAASPEDVSPLERALADLSRELRLPLLLHYYVGLPLDQVAAALGLGPSAVKSRLHRARAVLRRVLVDEEER